MESKGRFGGSSIKGRGQKKSSNRKECEEQPETDQASQMGHDIGLHFKTKSERFVLWG